MTPSTSSSSADAGPAGPDTRVALAVENARIVARSDNSASPTASEPFGLPPLPGEAFDRMSRVLRLCWRRASAGATWLLYVHPPSRAWRCELQPQTRRVDGTPGTVAEALSASEAAAAAPDDAEGDDAAAQGWLMAGSYSASRFTDDTLLVRQLPPGDGLHLYWEPGNWATARAYAVCQGVPCRLPVDQVVCDFARAGEAQEAADPLSISTAPDGLHA
jgi:hypothetical protein